MDLTIHLLLEDISKRQGLGLSPQEMALIINTDDFTYVGAYLMHEDDEYLTIIVTDPAGHEYAKIIKKHDIINVEVLYAQMLEDIPKKDKGDVMYV